MIAGPQQHGGCICRGVDAPAIPEADGDDLLGGDAVADRELPAQETTRCPSPGRPRNQFGDFASMRTEGTPMLSRYARSRIRSRVMAMQP